MARADDARASSLRSMAHGMRVGARVPCSMPRRTLPRILADMRSAVLSTRWHRLCAEEVEHDPASDTEIGRNDYQRLADEYAAIANELRADAVRMLRRSNRRQLAAWFAHPDARVRQFVLEWMSVRD